MGKPNGKQVESEIGRRKQSFLRKRRPAVSSAMERCCVSKLRCIWFQGCKGFIISYFTRSARLNECWGLLARSEMASSVTVTVLAAWCQPLPWLLTARDDDRDRVKRMGVNKIETLGVLKHRNAL